MAREKTFHIEQIEGDVDLILSIFLREMSHIDEKLMRKMVI
jgi:hypothetical protein